MYGLGVPSKSYNIMASGKPMLFIGDRQSEIALCIEEYSLGWVVEPDNPKMLARMIEHIYSNRTCLSANANIAKNGGGYCFCKRTDTGKVL